MENNLSINENQLNDICKLDAEKRLNHLLKQVNEQQQIWLLTDEHGSVMMTTDEEDCIPVWPYEEAALLWATGEWDGFEAKAISLKDWFAKWTRGLEEDELSIVVFPLPEDDGAVLYPDEFEFEIKNKSR